MLTTNLKYIDRLITDAPEDIYRFAAETAPAFAGAKMEDVNIEVLKGGLTNQLFKVSMKKNPRECIVVRIFGKETSRFINRPSELYWQSHFLATFGKARNGLVYEFMHNYKCMDSKDMVNYAAPIAASLAAFHFRAAEIASKAPNAKQNFCVRVLTDWLHNACDPTIRANLKTEKEKKIYDNLELSGRFSMEAEWLLSVLESLWGQLPETACHNDLLGGNIMRWAGTRKAPGIAEIRFLDFEYMQRNYVYFDIANHFCEWAGFECDWSRFPTDAQVRQFVYVYRSAFRVLRGKAISDIVCEGAQANRVVQIIKFFTLISHVCWSLWAVIQAAHSKIEFAYMDYAELRMKRYGETKQEFSAFLSTPSHL